MTPRLRRWPKRAHDVGRYGSAKELFDALDKKAGKRKARVPAEKV